jgi:stage II sporulation protein D
MITYSTEPTITVGLMSGATTVPITLAGTFTSVAGQPIGAGQYVASQDDRGVLLDGPALIQMAELILTPADFDSSRFTIHGVTIGVDFHWERTEAQTFQGSLRVKPAGGGLVIINELPLESYLASVISSEMSASCPVELLRAHAIVSRSWLLAQLESESATGEGSVQTDSGHPETAEASDELIRWYNRESHSNFDVCADDHCQRYQGITKAFSEAVFQAIRDTRGQALVFDEGICDARYSKSCGGMTERYSAAWEDRDVPYLPCIYDGPDDAGPEGLRGYVMPLAEHSNAERWLTASPPAYCNASNPELLSRILPGFDQETTDFYRWQVVYGGDELGEIVRSRLGVDVGPVLDLEPLERGCSGRITKLRLVGQRRTLVIGKELQIRRALSCSHLYSSAFVVRKETAPEVRFRLIGGGWGHGVGMCQIGAAVMADQGKDHSEILRHYFRRAAIKAIY